MSEVDIPAPITRSEEKPREQALGRKVSHGMSWMVIATLIGKILSFGSAWVLGILLDKGDYAVYGIAMGLAAFAQVLRDGGMRQILIQKRAHRYDKLSGPMFWFSGAFNGGAGVLLGLASWPIAWAYNEPELGPVLLATAVSIVLTTPLGVYRAKMAVDLQFRQLASINTWSAVVRYVSMIAFAWMGMGPLAFTLPLVLRSIFEGVYGYWVTHDSPWMRPARLRLWGELWGKSKWLIFGTFAMSLLRQGDYLVLGWLTIANMVTKEAVGLYVFAYQIAVQINVLVAVNLQTVLFPALSKLTNEPRRHAQAVLRATRVMMLAGSGFGLGLACTFEPLQTVLWGEKWSQSVMAVIWMAAFFPMRLLTSVLNSAQLSKGRYGEWFWLTMVQGVGMMLAAALAGFLWDDAGEISLIIGIYFVIGVAPTVLWGLQRCGVGWKDNLASILPTWLVACGAAAATVELVGLVTLPSVGSYAHLDAEAIDRLDACVQVMLLGTVFSLLYLLGLRTFTPRSLAETIDIGPARFRRPIARLLRLPQVERMGKVKGGGQAPAANGGADL
ncbi:MAG: oligosaccharide flippase family protein [Phycisphaerales bacterium]|nr:oligosaccharide flippase family protein [Phycisphaerales bacterium]